MSGTEWPARARGGRMALVLAIGAFAMLGPAGIATAADDDAWIVVQPASPANVEFKAGIAELSVSVLNESAIETQPTAIVYDAASGAELNGTAAGFASTVTVDPIAPRAIGTVKVTVDRGDAPADKKLDAVLVISSPAMLSATLRLTEAAAASPVANVKLTPATVTINATRGWPSLFFLPKDRWIYGLDLSGDAPPFHAAWAAVHPDGLSTDFGSPGAFLSSDRGGEMFVQLLKPAEDTGSRWLIRLGEADGAGKYAGTLSLDPATKDAPGVAVTVNVQDFIAWPIAVMVAGLLVAWQLNKWRDVERPKQILVHHLMRIGETYINVRKRPCEAEGSRAWLVGAFHIRDGKVELRAGRKTVADGIYAEIRKAPTNQDLETLEDRVTDLEELVARWEELCVAATSLRALIRAHQQLAPDAGVFAAANDLLARKTPLASADKAVTFLRELNDQRAAIELLVAARLRYETAMRIWNQLTPAERRDNSGLDPRDFWAVHVSPQRTKEDFTSREILEKLENLHAALLAVLAARPPLEDREGLAGDALDRITREVESLAASNVLDSINQMIPAVERRTAAAILDDIRKLDRSEFFITGAVVSLAFLLTSYVDKNFGTEWQYLTLFLAAVAGTLAINWKLLPWYREYRLPEAE